MPAINSEPKAFSLLMYTEVQRRVEILQHSQVMKNDE
jgi:hypothetical protein